MGEKDTGENGGAPIGEPKPGRMPYKRPTFRVLPIRRNRDETDEEFDARLAEFMRTTRSGNQ